MIIIPCLPIGFSCYYGLGSKIIEWFLSTKKLLYFFVNFALTMNLQRKKSWFLAFEDISAFRLHGKSFNVGFFRQILAENFRNTNVRTSKHSQLQNFFLWNARRVVYRLRLDAKLLHSTLYAHTWQRWKLAQSSISCICIFIIMLDDVYLHYKCIFFYNIVIYGARVMYSMLSSLPFTYYK